jgi:hypothetical protein
MRVFKVRVAVVVVGALFCGACASNMDGADPNELQDSEGVLEVDDGVVGSHPGSGDAVDESPSSVEAEQYSPAADESIASADAAGLELGTLGQELGGSCGSDSGAINSVFRLTAVPDHFPPDSAASQLASLVIGVPIGGLVACVPFGIANMGPTCDGHDACYGTLGTTQSQCDEAARAGWERACKNAYDSFSVGDAILGVLTTGFTASFAAAEQGCREACLGMAQAMFAAVSGAGAGAFAAAQAEAALPQGPVLNPNRDRGPIFF